eukprot:TRINITY_DN8657_c0_g1_i1.p1 TRINITY_DN8657_c0_g1~~TRINITY_DN8657_c0_g1_i1.p1  ORF type:complete len:708 (+),score=172.64 TRINITY_DN8657_c0_g1_i1:48-2171(+)
MNPVLRRVSRSVGILRPQRRLQSSKGEVPKDEYEYQSQTKMGEEFDRSWAEEVRGRQQQDEDTSLSWLSGEQAIGLLTESRYKLKHRKAQNPGEKPRIDYLQMMEMAYGPKEYWHQADLMFMKRMIPVLCRKIDDLRERLGETHRAHRKYRDVAESELKKIPLYKREAWMSPDLTRTMLVDDLRSNGMLNEDGGLKSLEAIVRENEHLLPKRDVETVYVTKSDNKQIESVPSQTETDTPTPETTDEAIEVVSESEVPPPVSEAESDEIIPSATDSPDTAIDTLDESEPLVVDPLLSDIYAPPSFYGVPEKMPYLPPKPIYERLPGVSSIRKLVHSDEGENTEGCHKIWVKYDKNVIEADLDTKGRIRKIESLGGTDIYADPQPRYYNSKHEVNKEGIALSDSELISRDAKHTISIGGRKTDILQNPELARIASSESEGKKTEKQSEPEPEMYQFTPEYKEGKAPDPVMDELVELRSRRRSHQSDIWEKVAEPITKPGNMVADAVTKLANTYGKAGVPLKKKIEAVEKIALSTMPEVLLNPYCDTPKPAPDAVDSHLANIEKMSSHAIQQIEIDAREITKRLKPARIEGASYVNLLPTGKDALKYNHKVVTDEGVWFRKSKYVGKMGKPVKADKAWPEEAVLVPTQIYKDVFLPGYEGASARAELTNLTQGEEELPLGGFEELTEEVTTPPVTPPKGGFTLEDFPEKN